MSAAISISFMRVAPFVKFVYKRAARRFRGNCQDVIVTNFASIYCAFCRYKKIAETTAIVENIVYLFEKIDRQLKTVTTIYCGQIILGC